MSIGTVVVLPADEPEHSSIRGRLLNGGFAAVAVAPQDGPSQNLDARICLAVNELHPAAPLTFVAFGESALSLPALALSQRAFHRRVTDYVLVDPVVPPVTDVWPDAPVTVYLGTGVDGAPADQIQMLAELRAWTVRPLEALMDWTPRE